MADLPAQFAQALHDRYVLERELGRGGMATVYLARDLKHDRPVALKVLRPEVAATLGPERFQREIRFAARLQHPHILSVHDSGDSAGQLWFTMPYVEGESLRTRLTREGPLAIEAALRIAREAGDALEYAHQHGVIHRDIKPENLLLTSDGNTLVADFGIARALGGSGGPDDRLTETGLSLGTPRYMSPEQASADRALDARTDVYSLGCVLYEMLAGHPPFLGATAQEVMARHALDPVPPLRTARGTVPEAVERGVMRALAKVPADRFATAAEFAHALTPSVTTPTATPTIVPPVSPPLPAPTPIPSGARGGRRGIRVGLAALGIGFVLGLGILFAWRRAHRAVAPSDASDTRSIAILPLANVGGDTATEYFADGMSEELAGALGKVPGLRVAARTSAFAFKGKNPTPQEVNEKLHVNTFLTGSVRRAGTALRVTTELVNVRDGMTMWSNSYARDIRDARDVFQVQDEIARAVVIALGVALSPTLQRLAPGKTMNTEAHDLYLKGRFAWNRRTTAALKQAAQYFEQAITLDPRYADAYAGLADADVLLPQYGGAEPRVAWPQARIAAERALALDSTLAEAHASLAYGEFQHEWKWEAAESGFRRALALDPNYATGHQWYGDFLDGRGRLQDALEQFKRAQQLDPLSRVIGMEVGWGLYRLHRYDEAVAEAEQVVRLDPDFAGGHMILGFSYLQEGMAKQAVAELRQSVALGDRDARMVAGLSCAYAALGKRDSADNLLAELTERSAREYVPPSAFALAYAGLGELDRALRWMTRGVEVHDLWLEDLFDPLLDPVRADARFRPIARSLGLQ